MLVGIPRGFYYHLFSSKMIGFFDALGIQTIISPKTNQKILQDGISLTIDETCLAEKIYLGHVKWLVGKCDKIFIPRIRSFSLGENTCPKFWATYDIAKTMIAGAEIITHNIDGVVGFTEEKAYIDLGEQLSFTKAQSKQAYKDAVKTEQQYLIEEENKIVEQLKSDKLKIAVIGHSYETNDEFVGAPIIRSLKKHGAEVILASNISGEKYKEGYKKFATTFNWFHNKQLLGLISWLMDKVDGIVTLSVFPCGPDSMTNELLRLKQKKVPMINLIVDEAQGQGGVETRIESFIDVLNFKKLGGLK